MNPAVRARTSPAVPDAPWERFGWVIGSIWLVFLLFPLIGVLDADAWWVWRALTVGVILTFAGTTVHGYRRLTGLCTDQKRHAVGLSHLPLMIILIGFTVPVVGWGALGMVAFPVAFAWFATPLRFALAVFGVGLLTVTALPLLAGAFGQTWPFVLVVGGVGVLTGVTRLLDIRQADHHEFTTQLALAQDRERVARDVHDLLGHSLTVITLKAELAERLFATEPTRAAAEVHQIRDVSRQALAEVRATVGGLRVARLAEEVASAAGVLATAGIAAELPGDVDVVDPRHRIVLAWALREAVTNVVRHSQATRCRVVLASASLTVSDDGVGLKRHREGHGIRGLRERVIAAGGALSLTDGPDGTVLVVTW